MMEGDVPGDGYLGLVRDHGELSILGVSPAKQVPPLGYRQHTVPFTGDLHDPLPLNVSPD